VVIGAGLAGLTAAHVLTKEGVPTVVLEARGRVGGRAHSVSDGFEAGQHGDVGGDLLGAAYRVVTSLCEELDVALSEETRTQIADGHVPATALEELLFSHRLVVGGALLNSARLDTLSRELRTALDDARPGRDETVAQWGRRARLSTDAHAVLMGTSRMMAQLDPHQVDAPWLVDVPAGGHRRVLHGAQRLADALAERLTVRLSTPVRGVRQRHGLVEVLLDHGDTLIAGQAIVAVSPFVVGTIGFDPPLPAAKLAALTSLQRAQGGKVVAQYAEGDAVRAAFSRAVVTDGSVNAARVSNPETTSGPAVVTGSVCGTGRSRLESEDAALALLDDLVRTVVGGPVTRIHGVVKNWSADEYALGVAGRPHLSERGGQAALLGAPERRVRFAGDYTDNDFCGTFEGAARSGIRAAREVLRHPRRVDLDTLITELVRA